MIGDIKNLRIHFYGVQGSGSVFPAKEERDVIRQNSDLDLLEKVFFKLQDKANANNTLDCSVEEILQGPLNKESLIKFRDSLDPQEQTTFGGWTTCFRLETSDGYDIVIDCGSGFRLCAQDLEQQWGDKEQRTLYILGTHAHFDHTEGFDQSNVCFDPRNHIHFFANRSYLTSLDRHLGIFSHQANRKDEGRPTPLNYEMMPASFESTEIRDIAIDGAEENTMVTQYHDVGEPIKIGKTTIQPFSVFHPDPCLAYRIEHNGKVFVFCTDHELRRGHDPDFSLQRESLEAEQRLIDHAMNADVLYRDGQFLRDEYDAKQALGGAVGVPRKDWGHSCVEDVVEMAIKAKVKRTYIGHHDPSRRWSQLMEIERGLAEQSASAEYHFELAKAETIIDL
ncbi:MAG: phosphoribosyl 1,2-cyclic phosphodiesterase [Arenicella sp.]|jgi:phosphoribosyl 1,2-cyclic phosphodiesterase